MSNWIQLTSGGYYDFEDKIIGGPFELRNDLAWPLSCSRWTRHTKRSWPVTLHSVVVGRTIERVTGSHKGGAAGLLHDAHEAVIGDITTPVARHIDYDRVKELKHDVQIAIFTKLDIDFDLLDTRGFAKDIENADRAALHVERRLFAAPEPREWSVPVPDPTWMRTTWEVMHELMAVESQRESNLSIARACGYITDEGVDLFCTEYNRLVQRDETGRSNE